MGDIAIVRQEGDFVILRFGELGDFAMHEVPNREITKFEPA
ncbi:MAG TPA: hypothetical protein VH196_08250 [Terriglobales bacterium]|jgi:hypothetical protein|nr:hypothetical protein [Terriglobales bacterium]